MANFETLKAGDISSSINFFFLKSGACNATRRMTFRRSPNRYVRPKRPTLDKLFSSNHNIQKSSCGLCFWASYPLSDRFF